MKDKNQTVEFFRAVFSGVPGHYVEMRAIPTLKAAGIKPRRAFVTTPKDAIDFVEKYGARGSQFGVYFGVGKRIAPTDGGKKNVAALSVLWADLDTVKNGWDTDEVLRTLHALKGPIRPNMVAKSGGGLHLYWMLAEPVEDHALIETVNRRLAVVFGGDNVHDVSRILRVPGSFNNKRKPVLCEVAYCYHWDRPTLDEVRDAIENTKTVFDGAKWVKPAKKPVVSIDVDPLSSYTNALHAGNRNVAKDIGRYWEDHVRYNAPRGYVGIHEAQLVTTARLHCAGYGANEIKKVVEITLNFTLGRMQIDAPDAVAAWDMEAEAENIRRMFLSFVPKWNEMKREYRAMRRAAKAA